MIKTMEQAISVQKRRAEAKRRGYAKAVRRFLLRANRRGEKIMHWNVKTESHPIAAKEYHCEASDWITAGGENEGDYDPEDWEIIQKARAEGWKILPGTRYLKISGLFDCDWTTFRAREDLDEICHKYDLYL